jgi:hypothetical protein
MNANDPFFEQMYESAINQVDEAVIAIKHAQHMFELEFMLKEEWENSV